MLAKTPVTIVTGFLGAGKTTLIRHILAHAGGRRLALIINEFGDVGVDGDLLTGCADEACPQDAIIELANGCICCTVADDFVPAVSALLARRTEARPHRHRDLRARAAEAAGQGVRLARASDKAHRRRRHCGGRRRRGRGRALRRRSDQGRRPARGRSDARPRQPARGGLRGPIVLRRPRSHQQGRPCRRGGARPAHRRDRRRAAPRGQDRRHPRGGDRSRRAARRARRGGGRPRRPTLASRRSRASTTTTTSTRSSSRFRRPPTRTR